MTEIIETKPLRAQRLFRDRNDAGQVLVGCLTEYRDKSAIVLGIPRGGVPVAAEVARGINAEMDIVVARKLGSPVSAELAIGAVTANGGRYLNEEVIRDLQVSEEYIEQVTEAQRDDARRREERFRRGRPAPLIEGRVVILVDDGLATGATMRAAVRSVRRANPAKLVIAVPVAPPQTCSELREEADEVICPHQPDPFWAIGLFYADFQQVQDEDVGKILDGCAERSPTATG
jgi:putative phosphoribosyl transferase